MADDRETAYRMGLVRWFLRQRFAQHPLWEEILAEGYVGMWQALADDHACEWTTAATNGALWAALDFLRSRKNPERSHSRKGGRLPQVQSLDAMESLGENPGFRIAWDPPAPDFVEGVIDAMLLAEAIQRYRDSAVLSDEEWEILERTVMDEELVVDVAKDMGISQRDLKAKRDQALALLREVQSPIPG